MPRTGAAWLVVALVLFGAAVGLIAFALIHGGATAGVILIFPFIAGSSPSLAVGVLLLVVGFFVLFFALARMGSLEEQEEPEDPGEGRSLPSAGTGPATAGPRAPSSRVSYGGFLLIGPVPVVFGNRPGWLPYLIALAVVTLLAVLVFAVLLAL